MSDLLRKFILDAEGGGEKMEASESQEPNAPADSEEPAAPAEGGDEAAADDESADEEDGA